MLEFATLDDVEDLFYFVNAAYRGDSSRAGWTTEADYLDGQRVDQTMLQEKILGTASRIFLLKDDKKIKACCELSSIGKENDFVEIGMICVSPLEQGQGWGKKIISLVEKHVQDNLPFKHGAKMHVIEGRTELIQWYQRLGYQLTGEKCPFPMQDPKFGIPKVDKIEFLIMQKSLRDLR